MKSLAAGLICLGLTAVPAVGADYDPTEKSPLYELHLRAPETAMSIAPLKEKILALYKADADQAWYHRSGYMEHEEVFLGFVNSQGTSSRRVYDLHTGRKIGDTESRDGTYHTAFASDLENATRLNGSWNETELDEWGAELPMTVLDALHSDLAAARAESNARTHAQAVHSEHPAAS